MKKIILFAIFLLLTLNKQSQADITFENGYISLSLHYSTYALKRITDMSAGSNIYFEDRESLIWQVTFLDTQIDSVETSDLYTRSSFEFDAEKSFIMQNTEEGQRTRTLFFH